MFSAALRCNDLHLGHGSNAAKVLPSHPCGTAHLVGLAPPALRVQACTSSWPSCGSCWGSTGRTLRPGGPWWRPSWRPWCLQGWARTWPGQVPPRWTLNRRTASTPRWGALQGGSQGGSCVALCCAGSPGEGPEVSSMCMKPGQCSSPHSSPHHHSWAHCCSVPCVLVTSCCVCC